MTVRYFAQLRDYTDCEQEIVAECESVQVLLQKLAARYDEPFRSKVLTSDGAKLNPEIFILVNGHHLRLLNGMETRLNESDEIALIPVIEAG